MQGSSVKQADYLRVSWLHWLIHRLIYRCTNHANLHVRGYKEEGTITPPFDMTVINDLDRFHLLIDTIDRLPQTGDKGVYLKQQFQDKLIEHKHWQASFNKPHRSDCEGLGTQRE